MTLTVHVGDEQYQFDGPYTTPDGLSTKSGVYVITTKTADGNHKVLDVGESGDVRARLVSHDRSGCWQAHEVQGVYMSAYYCDEATRMKMGANIRDNRKPPCGEK